MSDARRSRIAVLQHKRRQAAAQVELMKVSDEVGEPRHEPVEAGESLRLHSVLYPRLKEMRGRGQLRKREFPDAERAVMAAGAQLDRLGSQAVFEVCFMRADESGFFKGPISVTFLSACLRGGCETFSAVLPSLEVGVLLDVVLNDPVKGDFYEVEWW